MNEEKNKYRAAFSNLRASEDFDYSALGQDTRRRMPRKALGITVAAVAAAAALTVTAFAANLFGIKELVLPKETLPVSASEDYPAPPADTTLISLQGYAGSDEYKAAAEWQTFLAGYDADHAILKQVGNSTTPFDADYGCYLVYTQEMADKLDEICAKYNLKRHSKITGSESYDGVAAAAGINGQLLALSDGCESNYMSGYAYEDGSFQLDGEATINSEAVKKTIAFQFSCSKKGSFSGVYLNIGNPDSYTEWEHTTTDGKTVMLSLNEHKGIIIREMDGYFCVVNVLAGTQDDYLGGSNTVSQTELEQIADSFAFSLIG